MYVKSMNYNMKMYFYRYKLKQSNFFLEASTFFVSVELSNRV